MMKHTEDFKQEAVRIALTSGLSRRRVAANLGVGLSTLGKQVTAELNKGEARNTLARAVAFHRLGRFRDRGQENQQTRAAALNLVTAAIILFNCRYLNRAVGALNLRAMPDHAEALRQLSPLGWDHINLTGDYVWSDVGNFDDDGLLPLKITAK